VPGHRVGEQEEESGPCPQDQRRHEPPQPMTIYTRRQRRQEHRTQRVDDARWDHRHETVAELSEFVYEGKVGNDRLRLMGDVRRIRRLIEADPKRPIFMMTVRGRGFRLA